MSMTTRTTLTVEGLDERRMMSANPLTTIAAGHHGTAFGLDAQGHVYQQSPGHDWTDIRLTGKAIAAGTDAQGRDEVYVIGTDNAVVRYDQGTVTPTGGKLQTIKAGHGEAFGTDSKNGLWVYDDAAGWRFTGQTGTGITVGTDARGKDEVYLTGTDGKLVRYDQGAVTKTGGAVHAAQAGHAGVFGQDSQNVLWAYSDASGWKSTGRAATEFAVGTDTQGRDEVFLRGTDGTLSVYDRGLVKNTGAKLSHLQAGRGEVFGTDPTGELFSYSDATGVSDEHARPSAFAVGTDAAGNDFLALSEPVAATGYHLAGAAATVSPWVPLKQGVGDINATSEFVGHWWNSATGTLWCWSAQGWSTISTGWWSIGSDNGYVYTYPDGAFTNTISHLFVAQL